MFDTTPFGMSVLFGRFASLPFMFAADPSQRLIDYAAVPTVELSFEEERDILFAISRPTGGELVASFDDFAVVDADLLPSEADADDAAAQDAPVDPMFDAPLL